MVEANPTYASIQYADGREETVLISYLAPCPKNSQEIITETAQEQMEKPGDANSPLLHDEVSTDVLPNEHLTEKDCPLWSPVDQHAKTLVFLHLGITLNSKLRRVKCCNHFAVYTTTLQITSGPFFFSL